MIQVLSWVVNRRDLKHWIDMTVHHRRDSAAAAAAADGDSNTIADRMVSIDRMDSCNSHMDHYYYCNNLSWLME